MVPRVLSTRLIVLAMALVLGSFAITLPSDPVLACDVEAEKRQPVDSAIASEIIDGAYAWEAPWTFSSFHEVPDCEGGIYDQLQLQMEGPSGEYANLRVNVGITQPTDRARGSEWSTGTGQVDEGSTVLLTRQEGRSWTIVTQGEQGEITFVALETIVSETSGEWITITTILTATNADDWSAAVNAFDDQVGIPMFEPFALATEGEVIMAALGE